MNGAQQVERLRARHKVIALGMRASRTTDAVRWAKAAGYDTIWIDMEHSTLPVDTVSQLCSCAVDLGLMPWVRVPERDYGTINRVLDGGALGIIVARIESAAQARDAVIATRYPPLGQRSQLATLPYVGFEKLPARELNDTLNAATALKVLIESRAGVEAADEIAALDGVDILALGCNDLCADLGYAGESTHPEVVAACRQVIEAARRHGKVAIVGGMPEGDALNGLREAGAAPFIFAGIDTDVFLTALRERVEQARKL
ncbi:aldolase/citrate lyase family protein [Paraburkholderia sp. D15]|uniref:HpcH/HpaI aldolase family protein n=1 Tax=Paraburkholderia sp. D15 TaxID=2880218 RepID=UPI002479043B|nr:aldolase/citrate lyase family protein [Paraburkholderia sp. D15]WGS51597.1 aldolase/citrate lyase family protein [Paraburkholderia sp. D15]WKF55799.1 2-keto-3-deoxy-L-rhamnonate aldolase [Paraburkholderia busanensis]